jgi:hypothetical protein
MIVGYLAGSVMVASMINLGQMPIILTPVGHAEF